MGFGRRHPLPFPLNVPSCRYTYVARIGVYHAARTLLPKAGDLALAPAYHNGLEIHALRLAGAKVRFFNVNRRLEPDLDEIRRGLKEGARLVLLIHFNGWPQPIDEIRALCREHGAVLLEDCALAFLSKHGEKPLGSFGDAAFYSLYKTLAIPNGGALVFNGTVPPAIGQLEFRTPGTLSTLARGADLGIAWIRRRSDPAGAALARMKSWAGSAMSAAKVERTPVANMVFNERDLDLGMAPWARRLLERFDYADIVARRRANFLRLLARLGGRATPLHDSLPEGVCPLFFPLLVPDKASAVRDLAARGVEAIEFWNYGDPAAEEERFGDIRELRRHVIELPVHQDLEERHIDHVARAVLDLKLRVPGWP